MEYDAMHLLNKTRSRPATLALLSFVMTLAAPIAFVTDAHAKESDEKIAFGRVNLISESGDAIELDDPGVFKSGDLFLMWIVPESGEKATRLQVDESGEFFWKLEPGSYVVASYEWSRDTGGAYAGGLFFGERLWADFSVAADAEATYIGTLTLEEKSPSAYDVSVLDESDIAADWLVASGENLSGRIATSIMTPEDAHWKNKGVPICLPPLGIECDKRRDGVDVIAPKQTQSTLFRKIKTLTPTLEWHPSTAEDFLYDVIIYESYYQKAGFLSGGGKPGGGYEPGRAIEYAEGLLEPHYQLKAPLEPGKRYYWSVRLRHPKLMSHWSTRRVDTMEGLRMVSKYRELYGMRAPESRRRR
jgi:hypothetical protein